MSTTFNLQAKGKTVMYLPAEMMEIGEVSVAAKDKVERHILSFTNVDLLGTFEGEKSRGKKKKLGFSDHARRSSSGCWS